MRYEKIERVTHIHTEGEETEQQVLRAIVKASFELARPAGMGWIDFSEEKQMSDADADGFVNLTKPRYGNTVVDMDYVGGRQCKTSIQKVEDGYFTLNNHYYERDRGEVEPMLDRAKEILSGKSTQEGLASTSYMYSGESLTLRMKEYGFERISGESDWDFRKRVFPQFYQRDPDRSMEFLLGASAAEWNDLEKMLHLSLCMKRNPSHQELAKFARDFACDPIGMRRNNSPLQ